MKIAFSDECPYCHEWILIAVEKSQEYVGCPKCEKGFRVTVEFKVEKMKKDQPPL
jgi:ssDNA-binding Zn-finger/Zn-ribbon topoisomerase 1